MIIGKRKLGHNEKPYIIAELSANHGGSLERAKKSILEASRCGVDAIKIQSYTPDTMTIKCDKQDFKIHDGIWKGKDLYELYQSAYTPFEWHEDLFSYANKLGITIFSTPFDETAVDLLESLNTPAYKIASFELIDLPLIEYISKKNKPIFLSTGMASIKEIEDAVNVIKKFSKNDLILFHCISSYPTPTDKSNLNNISYLREKFNVNIGLSDHTLNNTAALVAIGLGAIAIEKHFKIDDEVCGPDSSFSLNIKQLKSLVHNSKEAWLSKGSNNFQRADIEKNSTIFRRSLYFIKDLDRGHVIKREDIKRIRPGFGLEPKYFEDVVGSTLKNKVERGDPIKWDFLSKKK